MKVTNKRDEGKEKVSFASKVETGFRFLALCLLAIAAFGGVMSVIGGDIIVRYVVSGVVVFFCAKELA